jgi:rhamnose utilization protein RhaD (predicted bifunctional aldolase and dehydrogenase)
MRPHELHELARLSATLGLDPEQVQAAGGNTSLKLDGILWVKASGFWLADALERQIFVPVRLAPVLDGIASDLPDPVSPAVQPDLNPEGLRPSIETTLHALLPHRVVIHTHSVRAIALAIREDAEALLAQRLGGLDWLFVPYCQPGLPLTRAVAERLKESSADVIVLGNHGLVVGAETVHAADRLLAEVELRLEAPSRKVAIGAGPQLGEMAEALGLRPAIHEEVHGLAMDLAALPWITRGSLYPDHVIFLGPAAIELPDARRGPGALREALEAGRARGSGLCLVPGQGALLGAATDRSADELALCLALVVERLPAGARLRYLTDENEAALMNWDAEKYRQSLARARSDGF